MSVRSCRILLGLPFALGWMCEAHATVAPWGPAGLALNPAPTEVAVISGLLGVTGSPSLGRWASASLLNAGVPMGHDLSGYAQFGLRSAVGVRGLWPSPFQEVRTGWDVQHRMDYYPDLTEGPGLARPAGGVLPLPGALAQGLQVAMLTGFRAGPLDISLAPHVAMMTNRTGFGARYEAALSRGAFEVGYGGVLQWNPGNPSPGAAFSSYELEQLLGVRWALGDALSLHGLASWTLRDAYGLSAVQGLLGLQWSLWAPGIDRSPGSGRAPAVLTPAPPEPAVRPTPRPTGR